MVEVVVELVEAGTLVVELEATTRVAVVQPVSSVETAITATAVVAGRRAATGRLWHAAGHVPVTGRPIHERRPRPGCPSPDAVG